MMCASQHARAVVCVCVWVHVCLRVCEKDSCAAALAVTISMYDMEDKTEIEILAIGIGHDVSRYYNRAIKITDVNELGDVMISQLSSLFDKKNKLH